MQKAAEQIARHRDLRHLQGHVAPIDDKLRADLHELSRGLVSDHFPTPGSVRRKFARLYASAWRCSRAALAANVPHDNRVHFAAFFPWSHASTRISSQIGSTATDCNFGITEVRRKRAKTLPENMSCYVSGQLAQLCDLPEIS